MATEALAVPYVVNFQMVDTDKDGKIFAAEFKTGCGKGWVQNADASTTKDMIPPAKLLALEDAPSILLLKARTVQSEETRRHLQDAHQRVMSVATVQQQLHASGLNERIEIGPYLTKLCASLAASMVGERRALSIKVQASSGRAVSSEAVSIGLIVTELVINALKHGFPTGATGEILVGYDAQNSGWQPLGCRQWIGDPSCDGPAHTGLGTSIVEALAHQLEATVEKTSGAQGTTVTITAPAVSERLQ